MPAQSLLDARLAEIDRRLRAIQSGLRPAEEPSAEGAPPPADADQVAQPPGEPERPAAEAGPERSPAMPEPDPRSGTAAGPPDLVDQLRALGVSHERLLELHRELLSEYASLLERRVAEQPSPPEPAAGTTVAVDAGPFADADAVRAFERALAALPRVTDVAVREYGAEDRVVIDVQLAR